MRTTLDVDERLLKAARKRAAERGTTLTGVVEEALSALLSPRPAASKPFRLRWNAHRGKLLRGVDIADRDSLFRAMEDSP